MIFTIAALFLATLVWSAPLPETGNVTVSGPGVSDHGKPNLVCFPPSPMDIAIFVFVNYLTHAASSRIPAGASTRRTLKVVIDSLCYPILGVGYALDAIAQWSVRLQREFPWIHLPKDDLGTAHRAGALITACREEDWVPDPRDEGYEGVMVVDGGSPADSSNDGKAENTANLSRKELPSTPYTCHISKHIHDGKGGIKEFKRWLRFGQPNKHFNIFGGRDLPPGYGWVFIPWGVKIEPPKTNAAPITPSLSRWWTLSRKSTDLNLLEMPLGADYSLFQPIAAVVQAISAAITLYRTRGDQLDRYGFTSFGLTVVPYLVMSVVNFFAHFAVPKYSALYVVQSDVLDEATRRLGDDVPRRCVVGRLPPEKPSKANPQVKVYWGTLENGLVTIDLVESEKVEPKTAESKNAGPENTEPEIAEVENSEGTKPEDTPSMSSRQMVIPSNPKVGPTDNAKDKPEEKLKNGPKEDAKGELKAEPKDKVEIKKASDDERNANANANPGPQPQPQREIIVSRFPSVMQTDAKKPIGRKTIKVLHWAIGLSSLVIIAAISRLQFGTATRPRWRDIFIVWLVFSCLSAAATSMVFGVSGTVLKGCLWIVRKMVHLFQNALDGLLQACPNCPRGEVKDKKQRLVSKAKESNKWWGYANDVIMFKFSFFLILLVMISQQLLDYGDCTYFTP
ncbi:hypothetical protein B0T25DRAFT_175171 [Lasiosphaeria hispida]|uniref:Uncharacterized protein n=1 Tax=Lasiosphaeria hispida TaxID=260671 RepID=A0AAJ0MGN8_9PEZI|nr:hypothetical protein B0T25DRAFT_175171 [Lasiosphaeria hispida]